MKNMILLASLSAALWANPLKLEYSYGVHDFVVDNDYHTFGLNAGIYMTQIRQDGLHQSG
jgi:hypothetical protein